MCVTGLWYLSVATLLFTAHVCIYCTWACMGETNLCKSVGLFYLRTGGRTIKGLRLPEFYFLSATPLPPDIAWSSSRAFQRETIEWACGNWGRPSGSLLWNHAVRYSMIGKLNQLQSLIPQPLPEFLILVPPLVACCRLRLGKAHHPLCRSKLSHTGLRGINQQSVIGNDVCLTHRRD